MGSCHGDRTWTATEEGILWRCPCGESWMAARCVATTKSKGRCMRMAQADTDRCPTHALPRSRGVEHGGACAPDHEAC